MLQKKIKEKKWSIRIVAYYIRLSIGRRDFDYLMDRIKKINSEKDRCKKWKLLCPKWSFTYLGQDIDNGNKFHSYWVEAKGCDNCGKFKGKDYLHFLYGPSPLNRMLCSDCVNELNKSMKNKLKEHNLSDLYDEVIAYMNKDEK